MDIKNADSIEIPSLISKKDSILKHLMRYFGYSFWVGLEVVTFTGLPRLVIFPIVAFLIGKEEFGLFLFAFGVIMIIGKAPSAGLVVGVIRHLAFYDKQDRERLVSTSLRLCRIAMLIIVAAGILVAFFIRYIYKIDLKIFYSLIPMSILLYSWNLFELQMVRARVERKFVYRSAWYSLLAGLMFFGVPAAYFWGAIGMAWGVSLAFWISQLLLSYKQNILFKKSYYNVEMAKSLKQTWFHMSFAMILILSSRYIYRIILGMSHSYSDISILYGATNMIDLCLSPMTILQLLLLSMFGKFKTFSEIGKRQKYVVFVAVFVIIVGCTGGLLLIGPYILSVMFPEFATESARILKYIIMILPFSAIVLFSNPFIVKFGQIKLVPVLNGICLFVHLIPALYFIPKMGIKGAVISYNIGYGLSALSWLMAVIWSFKTQRIPINQASDY